MGEGSRVGSGDGGKVAAGIVAAGIVADGEGTDVAIVAVGTTIGALGG
jgi:hypothetical protein